MQCQPEPFATHALIAASSVMFTLGSTPGSEYARPSWMMF
jgi:hypothetical protein